MTESGIYNKEQQVHQQPRKLPHHLENFVDDWFLQYAERSGVMQFFNRMNLTPNMITTIGNIFRAISIWAITVGSPILFLTTAIIGYAFDCFDGHYARQYGMATRFGDYYDHLSDWIYHGILLWFIFTSPKFNNTSTTNKYLIIGSLLALGFLFAMHMGCQEHHYGQDFSNPGYSPTLGPLKMLCPNRDNIAFTKYFGSGTFTLYLYFVAFILLF